MNLFFFRDSAVSRILFTFQSSLFLMVWVFLRQSFIDIHCINVCFQERLEKENLRKELSRSQKEKEVILEQSKQAASQLRKFTALFLDASPKEIEKAKQKYNESR